MAFRGITNTTNERTFIASILPRVGVGNSAPLLVSAVEPKLRLCLLSNLNALVFDYVVRQKVGGTNMNFFIVNQLPSLAPDQYTEDDVGYISSRALELVFTCEDVRAFAEEFGYKGDPFTFNPSRREEVRAELDAYYAHLYGLTQEELRYILDPKQVFGDDFPSETFRVLQEREAKEFGEYRTQRLVLEAFEKIAELPRFHLEMSKRQSVLNTKAKVAQQTVS
jgi:hypothetical protein